VKPKPLFVGEPDQPHEDVVRSYIASIDCDGGYEKGEHWGQWTIDGRACWVTLVSAGPADWRFAVFADGPFFHV
jgi:hypothetical protein